MLSFDQFADLVDSRLKSGAPAMGVHDIERDPGGAASWKRNSARARITAASAEAQAELSLVFYVGKAELPHAVALTQTPEKAGEAATRIVEHMASWGEPAGGA